MVQFLQSQNFQSSKVFGSCSIDIVKALRIVAIGNEWLFQYRNRYSLFSNL